MPVNKPLHRHRRSQVRNVKSSKWHTLNGIMHYWKTLMEKLPLSRVSEVIVMLNFEVQHKGLGPRLLRFSWNPGPKLFLQTWTSWVGSLSRNEWTGIHDVFSSLTIRRKAEFQECDISSWPSLLKLFKFTFEKYGQIDVVAANAGIHGHERWLEDLTSSDGELEEPIYPAITVNLIGMLYSTSQHKVSNHSF